MTRLEHITYGFTWGPATVMRIAHFKPRKDRETYCIQVSTEAGVSVDIYVSRTGRSLRVFRNGEEMR